MSSPEEINATLEQLREGLLQLSEAVRTSMDTETEAEKEARRIADQEKKDAADQDYIRKRQKAADEQAISEELKNLGIRKKSSGETEKLEDQRIEITKKVNEALKKYDASLSTKTDAEMETYKTTLKLNSAINEQVNQNDRIIASTAVYNASQNDLIRVSNILLKQHQNEVELSKTLGDVGYKQQEQFEDSIGKLKVQLASTVKLTDVQYKNIAAAENALKEKNREIELATLSATAIERQTNAFAESINSIEKQTASAVEFTASQSDSIRLANMALKAKQREVEASKNLGDLGLRQKEVFQDTIGKLKAQLDSTVILTQAQYDEIDKTKKLIAAKEKEADSFVNQGGKAAGAFGKLQSASGLLGVAQEGAMNKFGATGAGALGVSAAFMALNAVVEIGTLSFNQWIESLDVAFQAQLAYTQQLSLGADGYKLANLQQQKALELEAKQARERSNMYKDMTFKVAALGVGLAGLATASVLTGRAVMGITGPIGILFAVISGIIAWWTGKKAIEERNQAQAAETAANNLGIQNELKDKLFQTFNELGNAGMTGAEGMTALKDEAHRAGFAIKNIDKFVGILKNSQHEMSLFGATAVDGVKNFAEVTGQMSDKFGMHFRRLGMDQEAQAAAAEKYMAQQARYGMLQGKTIADQAAGAAKYLNELDKTATLLGQTRKEQEDSRAAIQANENLQAAIMEARQQKDEARLKILLDAEKQAAAIYKVDKNLATGFVESIVSRGAAVTDNAVMARQSLGNSIDATLRGEGFGTKQTRNMLKELLESYQRTAGLKAGTGADMGTTGGFFGNVNAADTRMKNQMAAAIEEAKKQGVKEGTPEFDAILDKISEREEAKDKLTKEATVQADAQQKAAIAQDNQMIEFGETFAGATTKFDNAVDKFSNATKSPEGKFSPTWKDIHQQSLATHGVSRESAAMPINAAEKVEARPTDWRKQQIWDSRYAKGWNADGTAKTPQQKAAAAPPAAAPPAAPVSTGLPNPVTHPKEYKEEIDRRLKNKSTAPAAAPAAAPSRGYQSGNSSAAPAAAPAAAPSRGYQSGNSSAAPATSPAGPPGPATTVPASVTEQLSSVLKFTSPSGNEGNFKGLDQSLQDKLLAAATDYNATTGNKIQINSAFRTPEDQKRLWNESVKLGTPGKGPEGFVVAYPGTSPHESGRAVDIQNWTDPKAVAAMNKQGLKQTVAGDYVHFQQARFGGLFNGPQGGYPVELHGREAVVPLPDPSSKIKIESDVDKQSLSKSMSSNDINPVVETSRNDNFNNMLAEMLGMMENKFDTMIDKLDQNNTYSDKLVKAMA